MSKYLVYFGKYNEDSHYFNKSIDKFIWENYKSRFDKLVDKCNVFSLSRYYIDTSIYEIVNKSKYIKLDLDDVNKLVDNKFCITKINNITNLNYITAEFSYFNIQHYSKCYLYTVKNIDIIFGEYIENGLSYYDIFTKTSYPDTFIEVINSII